MSAQTPGWDAAALERFLCRCTGASAVAVLQAHRLSGGAIQENWWLQLQPAGGNVLDVVLRCDAASRVAESRSRAEEFALLQVAFEAGVTVPEPPKVALVATVTFPPAAMLAFWRSRVPALMAVVPVPALVHGVGETAQAATATSLPALASLAASSPNSLPNNWVVTLSCWSLGSLLMVSSTCCSVPVAFVPLKSMRMS